MIWHRLQLIVIVGTAIILVVMAVGMAALLERGERGALAAAETSLTRTAQAVENALNRQLLQVHGALASLPTLFAAAKASPETPEVAGDLLRGVNFQTLAYHDLLLVNPAGRILVSARARSNGRTLPFGAAEFGAGPTALIGPVRNRITGDWALYVSRIVADWKDVTPVAEVPLPTLMGLLGETGIDPRMRIQLERPNGQLIAALPHDELRTGQIAPGALGTHTPDGRVFVVAGHGEEGRQLAVVRASLYDDVRVVLTAGRQAMLEDWQRDRDRLVVATVLGGLLLTAFSSALLVALRQRERSDAERTRAATVLLNAIDAMSDGFVMWDEQDRLVTCNQRYRDVYPLIAPFLLPGTRYEDIIRQGVQVGQFPDAGGDVDAFVTEMVEWHRGGAGTIERRLPDGRWILVRERHTADGGIVGIRTDVTALKTMLAELAEANARATEAAEEAQRQNAALTEREGRIRFLAHHDDLTRLPNRVLFRERAEAALRATAGQGVRLALLYLDLDRFKDVNDTLGHPVGDALLRAAAERLRGCVGDSERIARLGGDEFAVISLDPAPSQEAEALSGRIIEALSEPYAIMGHTIAISVSVGIALADGAEADADGLLKQADLALYEAKAKGRGTYRIFVPEMDEHLRARLEMEADLREALAAQQFELFYQPIYELANARLRGFEALLRWTHPRRGAVCPARFIPLAEETGLIVDIGAWVLRQACADIMLLPGDLKAAVNISPVQLAFGDIVATVGEVLRETGLDPARLELEITETALFADDQRNLDVLRRLRALGVRVVLDDFGTGYSSLSHLRQFPLDKIKIDRSFVQEMTYRSDSAAIVDALAALAVRLNMTTTAEGIETAEQLDVARRVGCTEGQGYFLGHPQPIRFAFAAATETLRHLV
ncbi:EAL domain-containing protein [Ancylobacter sp. Lp-2]|uniref:bifunctional diguanylate cyclase/phosphodiesterase n=1 Tax=Ancylobacter sp. Lp-2 TaxID=2881339 RepID=UPI001E4AB24F|nr:EAL domain-containing protein [Ancylobacter sp. Lp-2]MCB4768828.1 EAL domain-containing protein [Ancylobacter sp. Lp-2]